MVYAVGMQTLEFWSNCGSIDLLFALRQVT